MTHDEVLASLTSSTAANWFAVAGVLSHLEATSRSSADGRTWLEVVGERLAQLDYPLSPGHLRKLRRVYRFLEAEGGSLPGRQAPLSADDLAGASLLAIETAERLFAIDPVEGRRALADCLAGLSAAEVERRLKTAQGAHPERLSTRQVGWQRRKAAASAPLALDTIAAALMADPGQWWGGEPNTLVQAFLPEELIPLLARTPRGFLTSGHDGREFGGLRLIGSGESSLLFLESVLVQASFFDRYWIGAEGHVIATLMRMLSELYELGVRNVGVLELGDPGPTMVEPIREPGSGERRKMLVKAIAIAQWDGNRRRNRSPR